MRKVPFSSGNSEGGRVEPSLQNRGLALRHLAISHSAARVPAQPTGAQAAWKLNPPIGPSGRGLSARKRFGTSLLCMVRESTSSRATPPAVTSAFLKPSVPVIGMEPFRAHSEPLAFVPARAPPPLRSFGRHAGLGFRTSASAPESPGKDTASTAAKFLAGCQRFRSHTNRREPIPTPGKNRSRGLSVPAGMATTRLTRRGSPGPESRNGRTAESRDWTSVLSFSKFGRRRRAGIMPRNSATQGTSAVSGTRAGAADDGVAQRSGIAIAPWSQCPDRITPGGENDGRLCELAPTSSSETASPRSEVHNRLAERAAPARRPGVAKSVEHVGGLVADREDLARLLDLGGDALGLEEIDRVLHAERGERRVEEFCPGGP